MTGPEPAQVRRVAAAMLGDDRIQAVTPLPSAENLVYRIDSVRGAAVVRLTPADRRSADELRGELGWAADLAASGVPVARPRDVVASGPHRIGGVDHHGAVFDYIDGECPAPAAVDTALLHDIGTTLAAIHAAACDPAHATRRRNWRDTGNYDLGRLDLPLASRKAADGIFDRAAAVGRNRLVHGDLGLRNVIRSGGRLVAIDFDDACTAPPAYDLAASLFDLLVDWGNRIRIRPRAALDALLAGYRGGGAADGPDLRDLRPLLAALVIERAITARRLRTPTDATDRHLARLLTHGSLPDPLDDLVGAGKASTS